MPCFGSYFSANIFQRVFKKLQVWAAAFASQVSREKFRAAAGSARQHVAGLMVVASSGTKQQSFHTFMVADDLSIKAEQQSPEFLPPLKLQSIRRGWRQRGGGYAVFPICQPLDRQQQTVNQSPLRPGRPSRCSEQTNYGGVVRACVFTRTGHHHNVGYPLLDQVDRVKTNSGNRACKNRTTTWGKQIVPVTRKVNW